MNVVVTGASSGIGNALVHVFCSAGDRVWGIGRRRALLEALGKQYGRDRFLFSECDIRNKDAIRTAIADMERQRFSPDIVILNAGIYREDLLPHLREEVFDDVFTTNFFGSLTWVYRFLPLFLKRRSGQFIVISSLVAFRPDERSAAYPASKAALSVAFRSLQARYGREGVTFKIIYLGPVATHIVSRYAEKRSFIALSPEKAAAGIINVISSSRAEVYIPAVLGFLFRISSFFPNALYLFFAQRLRR